MSGRSGGLHVSSRVLADVSGPEPGRTLVIFGGIHGNEPAGIHAIREVLKELDAFGVLKRGRVVAMVGNRRALASGERYLDRDLNRGWTPDALCALFADPHSDTSAEAEEQRSILAHLQPILEDSRDPVVFLDLHTTSGHGPPFVAMSDTLRNRAVAQALPIPLILGLEEVIRGSMLGFFSDLGHCGVAVEGGAHDDPESAARHIAAIRLVLEKVGLVDADWNRQRDRQRLADAAAGLPSVVEILYRHVLRENEPFHMKPGYKNFQPIRRGEILAEGENGPIRSPYEGLILMPRYQGLGEDGFFICREVHPRWMNLSAWIRRARLDVLAPRLPGVKRHDDLSGHLVTRSDAFFGQTVNLLHLFGYRRRGRIGSLEVFGRRRPDHAPPLPLVLEPKPSFCTTEGHDNRSREEHAGDPPSPSR